MIRLQWEIPFEISNQISISAKVYEEEVPQDIPGNSVSWNELVWDVPQNREGYERYPWNLIT